jgi:translation initiation factor 3 subunit B
MQLDRFNFQVSVYFTIEIIDQKNCTSLCWSPKGRFLVSASLRSGEIEFWDTEADLKNKEKVALLATNEHAQVTNIAWDPTGRYVMSSASLKRSVLFL